MTTELQEGHKEIQKWGQASQKGNKSTAKMHKRTQSNSKWHERDTRRPQSCHYVNFTEM